MRDFNNDDKNFKGIWVPSELWLIKDLSALNKILLSIVTSLDKGLGCKASNEYLSKILNTSESNVKKYLKKLKDLKYIEEISFDGRIRYLKSNIKNFFGKEISNKIRSGSMGIIYTSEVPNIPRQTDQNECLDVPNIPRQTDKNELYIDNIIDNILDNVLDNIKDIKKNYKKNFLFHEKKIKSAKKRNKKTKEYDKTSIQYKLSEFLYREIESQDPLFTEPNLNKWSDTMNLIIYADKKDPDEIKKIISWATKDKFHQNLLINPMYLRRNYETLRKQFSNSYNNSNKKETYIDKLIKENKF